MAAQVTAYNRPYSLSLQEMPVGNSEYQILPIYNLSGGIHWTSFLQNKWELFQ